MRHTPKLYFSPDSSVRESLAINRLIDEAMGDSHHREDGSHPEDQSSADDAE
jgi:hypothetical protein